MAALVAPSPQLVRHEFPFFAAQLNAAIGALLSGCLLTVMPKDWPPHERALAISRIPLPHDMLDKTSLSLSAICRWLRVGLESKLLSSDILVPLGGAPVRSEPATFQQAFPFACAFLLSFPSLTCRHTFRIF